MITIRCPQCHRLLNLPEDLRGTSVQCPGCASSFVAPGNPLPSSPLQVPLPQPGLPAGPPEPSRPADSRGDGAFYLLQRKVNDAAVWLRRGIVFDWIASILCCPCTLTLTRGPFLADETAFFTLMGGFFVLFVIGVLVLSGANCLQKRRMYRFTLCAGILALLLGLRNALQTVFLFLMILERAFRADACLGLSSGVLLFLSGLATVWMIVGGMKTLYVLQDRAVSRDFR